MLFLYLFTCFTLKSLTISLLTIKQQILSFSLSHIYLYLHLYFSLCVSVWEGEIHFSHTQMNTLLSEYQHACKFLVLLETDEIETVR